MIHCVHIGLSNVNKDTPAQPALHIIVQLSFKVSGMLCLIISDGKGKNNYSTLRHSLHDDEISL